jgi:anti-sigma factor RsiW
MSACNRFDIVAYALDDLSGRQRAQVHAHIQSCAQCSAYCAQVQRERAEFAHALPYGERGREQGKSVRFPLRKAYALAATLVLFIAAGMAWRMYGASRSGAGVRIKGNTALSIYVQTQKGAAEKRDGDVYYPGERIQFVYSAGAQAYFALASIDEMGRLSVYYPRERDSAITLEAGRNMPLPSSIVLDDYLGKELYAAFFSSMPFSIDAVRATMRDAYTKEGALGAMRDMKARNMEIHTTLITKKSRL